MTLAERVAAVQALGFTPRQAAFLTTVALHSGYCIRRQYAAFAGLKYGKNVRDFLDRLVDCKLADRITVRADRGSIYHLFARRFYTAIGQENNRNRRRASLPTIARSLMLLDFVLEHREFDWYATEADKMELFVTRLGVPESVLPQRGYKAKESHRPAADDTTRYWIQKLPLFVAENSVHFVCLVTDPQASGIESFVREHAPLLRHLPAWSLHAVMPKGVSTDDVCTAAYQRALSAASLASVSKEDLAWFGRTRQLVAQHNLRELGVADLARYRQLSAQIGHRLDTRFAGPLILHGLVHSYSQFGSFAGLA